jgi:hypothetical protein
MLPLGPEIEKRIEQLFAPEDREEVRGLLVNECGENIPMWKSAGLERLRFAALKLSEGKVDRVRSWVNEAKIDFRDVLMAAGFGDAESYKTWMPSIPWSG